MTRQAPRGRRAGTRHEAVARALRVLARERGPDVRLPTTRDLCASLNTNPVVLTYVLDELEAQGVLYRRDRNGIFVSPRIHDQAVVVLLDVGYFRQPGVSPFWGLLLNLLVDRAQRRAEERREIVRFRIVDSGQFGGRPLPENLGEDIQAGFIHGVVAVGLRGGADWGDWSHLPVVAYAGDGWWQVSSSVLGPDSGGRWLAQAIRYLAERGCRRIGLWGPSRADPVAPSPDATWAALMPSLRASLTANGLAWHPELMAPSPEGVPAADMPPNFPDQGRVTARRLFDRAGAPPPDGLLLTDDTFALGVLAELRRLGLEPERDVSLCSVANRGADVLYGYEGQIARIEIDPERIVAALFQTLDVLLAGKTPAERVTIVPPTFLAPL